MNIDLNLEHLPILPRKRDYRIGAIGAGFIMRDIHLVAYHNAGFNVVAITAKDTEQARNRGIARNSEGAQYVAGTAGGRPD